MAYFKAVWACAKGRFCIAPTRSVRVVGKGQKERICGASKDVWERAKGRICSVTTVRWYEENELFHLSTPKGDGKGWTRWSTVSVSIVRWWKSMYDVTADYWPNVYHFHIWLFCRVILLASTKAKQVWWSVCQYHWVWGGGRITWAHRVKVLLQPHQTKWYCRTDLQTKVVLFLYPTV